VKVEKVAKNGEKGQNSQPLSPRIRVLRRKGFCVGASDVDRAATNEAQLFSYGVKLNFVLFILKVSSTWMESEENVEGRNTLGFLGFLPRICQSHHVSVARAPEVCAGKRAAGEQCLRSHTAPVSRTLAETRFSAPTASSE